MISFIVMTLLAGFFGGLALVVLCWTVSDIAEEAGAHDRFDKERIWTLLGSIFTILLMVGLVFGGMAIYRDQIECDILGGTLSDSSGLCVKELPLN